MNQPASGFGTNRTQAPTLWDRVTVLETQVARLTEQLAQLQTEASDAPATAATPSPSPPVPRPSKRRSGPVAVDAPSSKAPVTDQPSSEGAESADQSPAPQ